MGRLRGRKGTLFLKAFPHSHLKDVKPALRLTDEAPGVKTVGPTFPPGRRGFQGKSHTFMKRVKRMRSNRMSRGFSLVELVIVIIIIGIIAAIAIPRVSRGSRGAGESALTSNLSVLRNAIELYASEHGNTYPGAKADGAGGAAESADAFESQLLQYSGLDGAVADARDSDHPFGPYLRKGIPPLPVGDNKGATGVQIDTVNSPPLVVADATIGWVYNPLTGDIIGNSDNDNEAGDTTYDTY